MKDDRRNFQAGLMILLGVVLLTAGMWLMWGAAAGLVTFGLFLFYTGAIMPRE